MELNQKHSLYRYFYTLILALIAFNSLSITVNAQEEQWEITETFKLSLDSIEWTETQYSSEAGSFIQDGGWIEFYERGFLISPNNIYVKFYEVFNWTTVNNELGYGSFTDFQEYLAVNATWWVEWDLGYDPIRYGISSNTTFIDAEIDGDIATIYTQCHITNVPELLIGWSFGSIGFDLKSISLGKLEIYEYIADYTSNEQSIYVHIKAPSHILEQTGEYYNATIKLAPWMHNTTCQSNMITNIIMPPQTLVKKGYPTDNVVLDENSAIFTIYKGELLPNAFLVTSGPPVMTLSQLIVEAFVSPLGIRTIISLIILVPSGIQGMRMLMRDNVYNRLIRLMVKLYEDYRTDPDILEKEMDNLTESIFRVFIENKIAVDHLEKMLTRRDDLLSRSRSTTPSEE